MKLTEWLLLFAFSFAIIYLHLIKGTNMQNVFNKYGNSGGQSEIVLAVLEKRGGGLCERNLPPDRAPVPTWLAARSEVFCIGKPGIPVTRTDVALGTLALYADKGQRSDFTSATLNTIAPLGPKCFSVLAAVCQRLAMPSERVAVVASDSPKYLQCRQGLGTSDGLFKGAALMQVELRWADLIRTLGLVDTAANRHALRSALSNLATMVITVAIKVNGVERIYRSGLLWLAHADQTRVEIVTSPFLWAAPVSKLAVTWIDLGEQRKLKSAAAKRLHAWLSWFAPGNGHKGIRMQLLVSHVWGGRFAEQTQSAEGLRRVRATLNEVGLLHDWLVEVDKRNMVFVTPPSRCAVNTATRSNLNRSSKGGAL